MFCISCGTAISETTRFCPNCGVLINTRNPAPAKESSGTKQKLPILLIGFLLISAIGIAMLLTTSVFISSQILIGQWRGGGQTDYDIFEFSENGNYLHSMFEEGKIALKTAGRYEIRDKRVNLCDAVNLLYHPKYKVKESAGNNCSNGKPDGWIEIKSMSDDTIYTTNRGTYAKIK